MTYIRVFLSKRSHFLMVKFSVYLNRHGFVMPLLQWGKLSVNGKSMCTGLALRGLSLSRKRCKQVNLPT